MDYNLFTSFLSLVRLGIGHSNSTQVGVADWLLIKDLAEQQGLSAVVLDGLEKLSESNRPPKEFTLQWIGEVLQAYECRYEQYQRAIAEMAGFYNTHGFKMMVLKGYACSLDWPKPNHRPCGDIDIWLFGKQKESDKVLANEKGIKIDTSHHHHTVFYWGIFMVENHYDFINVHRHLINKKLEEILKELGNDNSFSVEVLKQKVFLPSPNLHSFLLLCHMIGHFVSSEITIRQLMDWGFHVKHNKGGIDWDWLLKTIDKFGMKKAVDLFNAILVDYLDFEPSLFPVFDRDVRLEQRVLSDILYPIFSQKGPSGLFPRVVFKFRRWRANAWKHKLCYKESLWSAFWSGVWNHLLKPSSI